MGRNSVNNWIFKQKSNEKIFESRWISFFFLGTNFIERDRDLRATHYSLL